MSCFIHFKLSFQHSTKNSTQNTKYHNIGFSKAAECQKIVVDVKVVITNWNPTIKRQPGSTCSSLWQLKVQLFILAVTCCIFIVYTEANKSTVPRILPSQVTSAKASSHYHHHTGGRNLSSQHLESSLQTRPSRFTGQVSFSHSAIHTPSIFALSFVSCFRWDSWLIQTTSVFRSQHT